MAQLANLEDGIRKVLTELETWMLERVNLETAHEELRQNLGAHQAFLAAFQSA